VLRRARPQHRGPGGAIRLVTRFLGARATRISLFEDRCYRSPDGLRNHSLSIGLRVHSAAPTPPFSVGGVERLLDRPRDPATTGHLLPRSLGPLTDGLDLVTVGRYGCCLTFGATLGRRRLRDLYGGGCVDEAGQFFPQPSGMTPALAADRSIS